MRAVDCIEGRLLRWTSESPILEELGKWYSGSEVCKCPERKECPHLGGPYKWVPRKGKLYHALDVQEDDGLHSFYFLISEDCVAALCRFVPSSYNIDLLGCIMAKRVKGSLRIEGV